MPIFELVQEMMLVNTCVKFHHNRLRDEVCRAVTPLEHKRTYVRADPYIPCEGIIIIPSPAKGEPAGFKSLAVRETPLKEKGTSRLTKGQTELRMELAQDPNGTL